MVLLMCRLFGGFTPLISGHVFHCSFNLCAFHRSQLRFLVYSHYCCCCSMSVHPFEDIPASNSRDLRISLHPPQMALVHPWRDRCKCVSPCKPTSNTGTMPFPEKCAGLNGSNPPDSPSALSHTLWFPPATTCDS